MIIFICNKVQKIKKITIKFVKKNNRENTNQIACKFVHS